MTHVIERADLLAYLRGNRWLAQNGYIPKAHAILCDPPYFLGEMTKRFGKDGSAPAKYGTDGVYQRQSRGFMGKTWDGFESVWHFQAWVTEWAELLLDYVHPGALGLFFGGTRTYHRLAAGLEDSGWEIADCFLWAWTYGSGFPKSLNIEKATNDPKWRGFGSSMKPAFEPVVVARAPRGKHTYAALARQFGTGALNVDGSRIGTAGGTAKGTYPKGESNGIYGNGINGACEIVDINNGRWPANFGLICTCDGDDHADDCPVYELGRQSGERPVSGSAASGKPATRGAYAKDSHIFSGFGNEQGTLHNDTGTAARFFYQAKAAGFERMAGLSARSTHPTTKPIKLAEYLARLILPPELDTPRRLLVPFAGSGSEMIGALLAGWDVVTGIEREAEYVELAEARVGWWAQFETYDEARAAYEKERKAKPAPAPIMVEDEKPAQLALFDGGAASHPNVGEARLTSSVL